MMRALILTTSALVVAAGVAIAAEPIKVELKNLKWKYAGGEGNDELGGFDEGQDRFFFYTNGTATGEVEIPADGEFTITIDASCTAAEKELAKFKLTVGETEVAKEFTLKQEESKAYDFTTKLKKGKQKLVVTFLNDKYKDGEYDLNLFLHGIKIAEKK